MSIRDCQRAARIRFNRLNLLAIDLA